jgi:hypothetical protein
MYEKCQDIMFINYPLSGPILDICDQLIRSPFQELSLVGAANLVDVDGIELCRAAAGRNCRLIVAVQVEQLRCVVGPVTHCVESTCQFIDAIHRHQDD